MKVLPEESEELEDSDFRAVFVTFGVTFFGTTFVFVTFGCSSSELSESDELELGLPFFTLLGTISCTTFFKGFVTFSLSETWSQKFYTSSDSSRYAKTTL